MSPKPLFKLCLTTCAVMVVSLTLMVTTAMAQGPGDLDTTFDTDGKATINVGGAAGGAQAVAIQADGKIVVAGYDGNDFTLMRYNSDGTLDSTFDTDGKVTTDFGGGSDIGEAVAIQPDGKIVVAGNSFTGGKYDFILARYNSDGSLDTTFDTDGKVTTDFVSSNDDVGYAMALQPDGKIVVAGRIFYGGNFDFALARYTITGTLDSTFDTDGKVITNFGSGDEGQAVAVQADGKIVVAGQSGLDFALARYTITGTLDSSFDGDGKVTTNIGTNDDIGYAVALQADGKIVVAGKSWNTPGNYNFSMARYNGNGTLDNTFGAGGKVTTAIGSEDWSEAVAIQADGKIVAAGQSNDNFALARYNSDGSLDNTFGSGGTVTTNFLGEDRSFAVALQPADGKIVVVGYSYNGSYDIVLARYWGNSNCYTKINNNSTTFASMNADAVQQAIDAAVSGDTIKIAGHCAGVNNRGGTNQTVYISQTLTIQGGYTTTNWTSSNVIANPTILDAQGAGHVIYANQPTTIQDIKVQNGVVSNVGGGIGAMQAITLSNVIVYSNTASSDGGGAYFWGAAILTGTTFLSNTAVQFGGGAICFGTTIATRTAFIGNIANFGGGVVLGNGSGPNKFVNGLFSGNKANVAGDALRLDGGTTELIHTTIASPTVGTGGMGAVHVNIGSPSLYMTNSIIASYTYGIYRSGGTVSEDYNLSFNAPNVGGVTAGTHSIVNGNPAFLNPANNDYHLTSSSMAIDKGTDLGITTDYFGNPRPHNAGIPDIGYDESPFTPTYNCYAKINAGNVYSSTDAVAVQDAVDNAVNGDTVKVAGYCAGVNNKTGTFQTVHLDKPLTLQGGYTHTTWIFDPAIYPTTLDALGGGRGVFAMADVTLSDIKVQNGKTTAISMHGGGIYALNAMTLDHVTVYSNTVTNGNGGGAYFNGTANVMNAAFMNNTANHGGGGYFQGTANVSQTNFINNNSSVGGGAEFAANADVVGSVFEQNSASTGSGAYFLGTTQVISTTFRSNRADFNSSSAQVINNLFVYTATVVVVYNGQVDLIHNTITSPSMNGYVAVNVLGGTVNISNTIIANYGGGIVQQGGTVNEDYNLFNGTTYISGTVTSGGHSINGNPAFVNPTNDYNLTSASMAIDTGTDAGVYNDFNNEPRPKGNGFDMGCYESPFAHWPDVAIAKSVNPTSAMPGDTITYTLAFTNFGIIMAHNVVITDLVPISLTNLNVTNSGATITPTGGLSYVWQVAPLAVGQSGMITMSGKIALTSTAGLWLNTAEINSTGDFTPSNNMASANLTVNIPTIPNCYAQLASAPSITYTSVNADAVQDAVDNAVNGDTVKVAGYCASVLYRGVTTQTVYISQTLTMQGGYTTTNWTTSNFATNPTTLDALGMGRVIYADANVTLSDIKIQNGKNTGINGGGIYASQPMTLSHVTVYNNEAILAVGGGAYFDSTANVSNSNFISNTAELGGGAHFISTATLTANTFNGNSANDYGGGAYFSDMANVTDSLFSGNSAGSDGGGAYFWSTTNVTHSNFISNTAISLGGGACFWNFDDTTNVVDSTFRGNLANNGGGAYFYHKTANVFSSTFSSNTANLSGGGAWFGDIANVFASIFNNNTANIGGGVYFTTVLPTVSAKRMVNTFLVNNLATTNGAAIYVDDALPLEIIHTTIDPATPSVNEAVYVMSGTVYITNTIIADHATGIERVGGTVTEDYNLFYGNTTDRINVSAGANSLTGDPAFFDAANGDYSLTFTSEAIDVGTDAGVYNDVNNEPRPKGAGFDMGFIESPFAHAPDVAISKTANPIVAIPGDTVTYTIIFQNMGNGVAKNVIITDLVPMSLTNLNVVSSGATITPTGGTNYVWQVSPLAVGQMGFITISGQIALTTTAGSLVNISEINSTADSLVSNNLASATVVVNPLQADVAIAKSVTPTTAIPGQAMTYTLTFTNNGPNTAHNVTITDTIPPGIVLPMTVTQSGAVITGTNMGATYQWTVSPLNAGQGGVITLSSYVAMIAPTTIINQVEITGTGDIVPSNNMASTDLTVTASPRCFVNLNGTMFSSSDASAIQEAVNVSNSASDIIKVAGYCAGVQAYPNPGKIQTVYISKSLTIRGGYTTTDWLTMPSPTNLTTLDAQGLGRVVYITGSGAMDVKLENLRLTNGVWPNNADVGGGVYATNTNLTINNTTIYSNAVTGIGSDGGGLYLSGTVTISNTLIHGNSATNVGGGLRNNGTLNLYQSAIFSNTAINSGGIHSTGAGAVAQLVNSTISRNSATGLVGGINSGGGGNINLVNTTVASNTGYGIFLGATGSFNLKNSVVAYNSGANCAMSASPITSLGHNISSDNSCDFFFIQPGDLVNTDPLLGTLQFVNGTYAHPLKANSPALEAGTCEVALDQAEQARPTPSGTNCDIGAIESPLLAALPDVVIDKTVQPFMAKPGDTITYTIFFRNMGTGLARNVIITDLLPISLTNLNITNSGAAITPTGGLNYVWQVSPLATWQGGLITITGQIDLATTAGVFINSAEITSTGDITLSNNVVTASLKIVSIQTDVAIAKTVYPLVARPGDWLTYTLALTNNGPATAKQVNLIEHPPAELINIAVSDNFSVTKSLDFTTGLPIYTWQIGDLALDAAGAVTLSGQIATSFINGGQLSNWAFITSTTQDLDIINNQDAVTVTVAGDVADVTINKTVSPTVTQVGDFITYTLTFTNEGTLTATNVVITDPLPTQLLNPKFDSTANIMALANTRYIWQVQDLAPAERGVITITGQLDLKATETITNQATIGTDAPEQNRLNNSSNVVVQVKPLPQLAFSQPDYQVNEKTGLVTVGLTLTTAPLYQTVVRYKTADNTATAGQDYMTATGTLTFAPGVFKASFEIPIYDDKRMEGNETVDLTAIDINGAVATSTLTIVDNDLADVLIRPLALTMTENSTATYNIMLTSEPTAPVIIRLSSLNEQIELLSSTVLTFTAANWQIPQTVTVRALLEGQDWLEHDVTSQDDNYDGLTAPNVGVQILPNDKMLIGVTISHDAPTALGDPTTVAAILKCAVAGGQCPFTDELTYTWSFGDGTPLLVTNDLTETHTYAEAGLYHVVLTVTRGTKEFTATATLRVEETIEEVIIITDKFTATTDLPITFTVEMSSGDNITYTWNFGDGTISECKTCQVISHTYITSGTYTVVVTLTNSVSGVTKTIKIVINKPFVDLLQVTHTAMPKQPKVGETVRYLITVLNVGAQDATNVVITDTWPADNLGVPAFYGFTGAGIVGLVAIEGLAVKPCILSGAKFICQVDTLPAGSRAMITLYLTPRLTGTLASTVSATAAQVDPYMANNIATVAVNQQSLLVGTAIERRVYLPVIIKK